MTVTLRGMAWDHPRARNPLEAIATEWMRTQDARIEWDARPLKAFEDQPLEELATTYDLVLIDHPFVATAANSGLIAPVNDWADADYLEDQGVDYSDLGNTINDPDDDYPDYAFPVAEAVAAEEDSAGILVCGSAQGVCMAANKVKGVRAAPVFTVEEARLTREHNAANVLCLSGRTQTIEGVMPIINAFLSTEFSGDERHVRRLSKITEYEDNAG